MDKRLIYICLILLRGLGANAQEKQVLEGAVTYINIESVYVKFASTKGLKNNDTLEVLSSGAWRKILIINALSSTSCVTTNISREGILVGTPVRFISMVATPSATSATPTQAIPASDQNQIKTASTSPAKDSLKRKQTVDGRIYLSAFGSLDGSQNAFNQLRTSVSLNVNHINDGKFSFENHMTYRPRFGSSSHPTTFVDDFKMYALALTYEANHRTTLSFGRKINNRLANMGAIDGLQVEYKLKNYFFGTFAGFAPDYNHYGFNASLLQYGGLIAHEVNKDKGQIQSSIAFAEQRNRGFIDRRFLYLQHSNTMLKNVSLFYSLELDLYQNIGGVITHHANLTSTYLSVRYRPFRQLNVTASYDNRRNIIYYETFKTYLEQLLNQETRQGVRLQINNRLSKFLTINMSAFYRYQKSQSKPTQNYVATIMLAQIMGNSSYLNINFNRMNTYYFDGDIYEIRLNKDLFKNTVSTDLSFRRVNYLFFNENQPNLHQSIVGASLNFYGRKRPSVMVSYEATFEPDQLYSRYFVTVSQRFRSKKK